MPPADDNNPVTKKEHRALAHRIEIVYGRVLATFASTVALRDEGTGNHCERVARNAVVLARDIEDGQNARTVFWAGTLHDLGKIVIPETILNKPGTLDPEEWELMKTHADVGADLVAGVSPDFDLISEGIRSHHERWDGRGYPQALAGDEIPFAGRCVAVSDCFEAMTSHRPYRKPLSDRAACAYLFEEAEAGHLEDKLTRHFLRLFDEGEIYSARHRFIPPPPNLEL